LIFNLRLVIDKKNDFLLEDMIFLRLRIQIQLSLSHPWFTPTFVIRRRSGEEGEEPEHVNGLKKEGDNEEEEEEEDDSNGEDDSEEEFLVVDDRSEPEAETNKRSSSENNNNSCNNSDSLNNNGVPSRATPQRNEYGTEAAASAEKSPRQPAVAHQALGAKEAVEQRRSPAERASHKGEPAQLPLTQHAPPGHQEAMQQQQQSKLLSSAQQNSSRHGSPATGQHKPPLMGMTASRSPQQLPTAAALAAVPPPQRLSTSSRAQPTGTASLSSLHTHRFFPSVNRLSSHRKSPASEGGPRADQVAVAATGLQGNPRYSPHCRKEGIDPRGKKTNT
jgi:hypothetical protein